MQTDLEITAEQARYLHHNLPIITLGSFAGSCLLALLLSDSAELKHLLAWVGAYAMLSLCRMVVWWRFRQNPFPPDAAHRFFRLSVISAVLASSLWAAAMFLFFPGSQLTQQFVFFVAIVAVTVSAMSGQCSHYPSFLGSSVPFWTAAVFIMAAQQTVFHAAFAGLLIFIPMMLLFAWRFHRLMVKLLRLRYENAGLVEQLTAQKEAAEAATLAKSRFLAAASHDLRQPMHALNLYLGVLSGCDLSELARPFLGNVRQCAQTMDEMFRALLDISRLDASVLKAETIVFPMASLLDQIRVEFAPQARAKGLNLRVAPCSSCVRSDPILVERILRNLVSNAVRYTMRGKILVGCRRTAHGIRLAVCDTGPGIALDQQQAVFEEFYQIGNAERDRAQGLGLGLAIAQRLARLLGAPLTLVSTLGRGSVFSLDLPCAPAEESSHYQSHPRITDLNNLAGALVAVVDDEVAILDAMRQLLEQWGCDVIAAPSGSVAIARLGASSRIPDALICDYRLCGEESGLNAIDALRNEFNHDIPALLITGDTASDRIRQTQASGLTVLHKPLQEDVLREALSHLIDFD